MQPCIFLCKAAIIVCGVFLVCCHSSGMDLTTKSGTTYRNCSIHRGDKTGIYIKLGDSLKFIPLSDVPDDIAERYSANLKTKLGDIYYDYSVVRVRNDALKIKHKWGVSWVNKAVLPDFLLEKYKSTQVPAKAPPGNRGNVARNSGSRNSGDIVRNDGVARDNNTRRFDLASPKRIVQSDSAESWSKTVTVSGSGINEQTALEDAFRTAVREAVGAYVITRSTLKEGDFSEEIYINADAVISHHEIIKKSVSDGIIELVVRATVVNNNFGKYLKRGKSNDITTTDVTNLLNKRNSLNVAIKSVPYIFDEFLKNSCFIEKIGQFELSPGDSIRGENVRLEINFKVKRNSAAILSFQKRLMTLLDVVCVTSRLYKLRDTNDQTLESVKEQFIANYCGNKSGRFICFIDPVGKSMKCYLIPYQLYAALRMRCYSHSTQDIANGLFQPYVKENYCTVIIDFMLKDGTLIRRSFEADIRCWWSPGLFNYDMFFRSGALFFRAYASKDVNIEGKKLFVTIPKRFLVNLKKCAFSVYSGTHAKFLFAKHHRDVRTIHYLARSYVPAMIYAADDLGDKDYYFRAALMGSSYAQEKLGWQNRGLGFAMRQGKIVSIERTISGLYEGDVIKRINDRDLPRSEEELSKFIGAIPSASAVRLSFEGGREVTVIAK